MNEKYKESFEGMWDAIEQQDGCLTKHPGLITVRSLKIVEEKGRADIPVDDNIVLVTTQIQEEVKAAFMLSGAHNMRHKSLKNHLDNYSVLGNNKFPQNTMECLSMMNNFRGEKRNRVPPAR